MCIIRHTVSKNLRRLIVGPLSIQEEVNPVLTNIINNAAYSWRSAALFTSEMPVSDAFKGGKKRPATATARHAAIRALNGPIT